MNVEPEPRPGRADLLIDRATRVVRLLAWLAMFALCCLMLWVMGGHGGAGRGPQGRGPEGGGARRSASAGHDGSGRDRQGCLQYRSRCRAMPGRMCRSAA